MHLIQFTTFPPAPKINPDKTLFKSLALIINQSREFDHLFKDIHRQINGTAWFVQGRKMLRVRSDTDLKAWRLQKFFLYV